VSENNSAVDHNPWSRESVEAAAAQAASPATPAGPPTGWYPDPADAQRQRYWDGTNWTAETRTVAPPSQELRLKDGVPVTGVPGEPGSDPYAAASAAWGGGYLGAPTAQAAPAAPSGLTPAIMPVAPPVINPYVGNAPPVAAPVYAGILGPRTADGVPLAGWWWRVLATILDNVIIGILGSVILLATAFKDIVPSFFTWYQDVFNTAMQGGTVPTTLPADLMQRINEYTLAMVAIQAVYSVGLLAWRSATLGQMICQLRVVPTGQGLHQGGLPIGMAVIRVVVYLVLTSVISAAFSIYRPDLAMTYGMLFSAIALIAYLWPLFNAKRQGLHDLAAGTQVVRLG